MRNWMIYANPTKAGAMALAEEIRGYLASKGCRAQLWTRSGQPLPQEGMDALLVLGGDGTMLQAARDSGWNTLPLIGVNLGTLGYMTQIEPESYKTALDQLLAGEGKIQSRMLLQVEVQPREGEDGRDKALNDVVFTRRGPLKLITYDVHVNGVFLCQYHADGILLSTPTGSTGYNLSAGGPIVHPGARLLLLTPICAHTLNQRSIVLEAKDRVEISIPLSRSGAVQEAELVCDGGAPVALRSGDRVEVAAAKEELGLLQLEGLGFIELLQTKIKA